MPKAKQLEALGELFQEQYDEENQGFSSAELYDDGWRPNLNPVQREVFECKKTWILAYGERGTGKSVGAVHKLVDHCFNEQNALYFIIVREIGQASDGGAWHKLQTIILPEWKRGIDLEYTESRLDNQTKKPYIWIANRYGGWSMVMLISLFVGEHVEDKVKGKEPSGIFLDEAQTTESDEYFSKLTQQVGRRPNIKGPQQIVYAANPKGPSHWLYQRFFVQCIRDDTGLPDPRYAVFHVPISENKHNLPPGYWEVVMEAVRGDPVEEARMVRGEWIDKAEGDALFRDEFDEGKHVMGDAKAGEGLMPVKGYTIILGYDPGQANTSIHFEQVIPTEEKNLWLVFDEVIRVGHYSPYIRLIPKLIDRMVYWDQEMGKTAKFRHISDDSAFNQFRARDGSWDAADIEEISREYVMLKGLDKKFIIRMEPCPKGPNSIAQRVTTVKDKLNLGELLISAICTKTREMLMKIEEDKDDKLCPKKKSNWKHAFDSMSYPMHFFKRGRGRSQINPTAPAEAKAMVYTVGSS